MKMRLKLSCSFEANLYTFVIRLFMYEYEKVLVEGGGEVKDIIVECVVNKLCY